MPDENPTVDENQNTAENQTPNSSPGDAASQLAAIQAELEAERAKNAELTPLAEAARAAEEANKTEMQKLQEAAVERESKVNQLEAENTRLRLAQVYGLAEEDLGLLGTGSSEDMEANAKRLQELHAAAAKATPPPSNRPVDSMKSGTSQSKTTDSVAYPAHWTV